VNTIFLFTVEDPAEDFQRVRDFVDASNCRHLKSFQPESLEAGFSKEMVTDVREKLKINKVSKCSLSFI
jgi:histone acetyltransferase 1